ncbi:acyltransferase family protein [Pseudoroseicyclus sp. H15]
MKSEITSWTAIRGLAALQVVILHFSFHFTPAIHSNLIMNGHLAVDTFFILSGAVLYYVYAAAFAEGRFSYRDFMIRRLARIYPVHIVTMIAALMILVVGTAAGLSAPPPYEIGPAILLNVFMLQNWPILGGQTLNYPSWSIGAEFNAYLIFPLLAAVVLKIPARAAALAAFAFFAAYYALHEALKPPAASNLFDRTFDYSALRILPDFLLGLGLCRTLLATTIRQRGTWLALAGLALVEYVFCLTRDLYFIAVSLSALILFALAAGNPRVPRALHYLGLISYSIYMTHALIEMVAFKLIELAGGYGEDALPWPYLAPVLALTIAAGALSYHLIEVPARVWTIRLADRWAARRGRAAR